MQQVTLKRACQAPRRSERRWARLALGLAPFAAMLLSSCREPAADVRKQPTQAVKNPTGTARPEQPAGPAPAAAFFEGALALPGPVSDGTRRPLVVYLHGLGGSGAGSLRALRLEAFAKRHGVTVVAPDGDVDSLGRRFWDAHPACCNFDPKPVDHVRSLGLLVKEATRRYFVDRERIYVIGYSNGGFMAERLACAMGERLAGIASIAGASPNPSLPCGAPKSKSANLGLSVLLVHGDRDAVVRYAGGSVFDDPRLPPHPSAMQGLSFWSVVLGCKGSPETPEPLDLLRGLPGRETVPRAYSSCAYGHAELWTLRGGRHNTGADPALIEHIWRFFESHAPG